MKKHREVNLCVKMESQIVVNRQYPTQVFWCSTRLCDRPVLKPGQVEISQNYFVVVVFCIVHQVFQLNKMRDRMIILHCYSDHH